VFVSLTGNTAMSETRRSFRDHPLFQLTAVRFLEFVREPEALFWVFVFWCC
jgi:hypothetical protein